MNSSDGKGERMRHMTKRILVIAASPRKGGNSDLLCERFIEGTLEAGNTVDEVFLREREIGFCRARRGVRRGRMGEGRCRRQSGDG